ncbi:MAG TPA: NUDIX hydrolase [Chloroflexota bacterium]|jgi:ADP-ribose pyrophosphatase YjhB (NUDIX family)
MSDVRFCSACGAPAIEREIDHYVRSVCTGCGKILYRNPAPAAGCLVEHDGAVLLARRKFEPWRGLWYIPSGFVEYGDDVEDTARREIREETGLAVELGPLFGVYSYFDDPRQDGIIILYRAVVVGGALEAGDDAAEVAFFAARALPPAEQIGFATHRRALREWCDEIAYHSRAPLAVRGPRIG